jgi:hypothetical protein
MSWFLKMCSTLKFLLVKHKHREQSQHEKLYKKCTKIRYHPYYKYHTTYWLAHD